MPTRKLNVANAQHLIYETEVIKLTVLGGIKLEGLDRMRVTLKIALKGTRVPPLRHNLDLYNDNQLEKLIRKTAEKLEVGTSILAACLSELTEQLEQYRLEEIKKKRPAMPKRPRMGKEEKAKAIAFLSAPNLLERTNELIGQSGIIGEEINRLIMYLIFTSRNRRQPLHIVSLGSSGAGKTHLQEKVGELIPEEDKIEITTLSENAFYYFGQRELKHKLILIEDLDGAENVLYPLRELQSKKRISKTIAHKNRNGETKTMHLIVEGPVSVAGCTTREYIYEDNANRSFLIYLDESASQDQRIMAYQRQFSAGQIDTDGEQTIRTLLKNTQRLLRPINVVNPYAVDLLIPSEVFKPRRSNHHYLQFIELVTYYHQYQREEKADEHGETYIETTLEDIAWANRLMKSILLRKSDLITGACRTHFEQIKGYLDEKGLKRFTNGHISRAFRMSITTVKRHHLSLTQHGLLRTIKEKGQRAYQYEVIRHDDYQILQDRITNVLDENLVRLQEKLGKQQPTGPKQPNAKSEPVKAQIVNTLS